MFRAMLRIDDVERPVALLEAFFDEGEEDSIFLLLAVEEGADVPCPAEF